MNYKLKYCNSGTFIPYKNFPQNLKSKKWSLLGNFEQNIVNLERNGLFSLIFRDRKFLHPPCNFLDTPLLDCPSPNSAPFLDYPALLTIKATVLQGGYHIFPHALEGCDLMWLFGTPFLQTFKHPIVALDDHVFTDVRLLQLCRCDRHPKTNLQHTAT